MKRILVFALSVLLFHGVSAYGQDDHGGRDRGDGGGKYGNSGKNGGKSKRGGKQQTTKNRQPRSNARGSGGNYNNRANTNQNQGYGNRNQNTGRVQANQRGSSNFGRANNRVSPQLRNMGVHSFPKPFNNRNQMMVTDRAHSSIQYPTTGPGGGALRGSVYARTSISGPAIRAHMNVVMGASFNRTVINFNVNENVPGRYYWHAYNGFNYCHYYYGGYHWYGWYLGGGYFWTRYWGNHWWWYDPVYFRWCYWWDGGWWWQDPYNITVVYVYNNGSYVSASAGANVNAMAPSPSGPARIFTSPDGTRMVKVTGSGQDAFLYDTSSSPSFQPIYLASGVRDVKLSNTSNGRPLQIMLVLNDGSFDLFDDQGNPYNGNGGGGNFSGGNNSQYNAPPVDNGGNPPPADNGGNPPPADNGGNPPPADNGNNPPADNGGNSPPSGTGQPPVPSGT